MAFLPENRHLRFFLGLVYLALAIVALLLIFKYVLGWIWPFIIAFIIARLIEPLVRLLTKKAHIPHKLASIICVLATFTVLGGILSFAVARIVTELRGFFSALPSYISTLPDTLTALRNDLWELLEKLPGNIGPTAITMVDEFFADIKIPASTIQSVAGKLTNFAFSLPSALIFTITTLVATYFISSDYENLVRFIVAQFPEKWHDGLIRTQRHLIGTLGKWLRAMGIILFITFIELMVGFTLIGIDYAIIFAFFVALIDALPVLGIGTVLIPWALYALIMGDYYRALFLIIMYAVMTIVRNMIEPKIVGQQIGLHPLLTLVGVYVGYRIMGIMGMFLFPVLILTVKQMQEWGYIKLWREPAPAPASGGEAPHDDMPPSL